MEGLPNIPNSFSVLFAVDINEILQEKNNSILFIKRNPHFPNELITVNSNYSMNYLTLTDTNITSIGNFIGNSRINAVSFFNNSLPDLSRSFISGDDNGNICIWNQTNKNPVFTLSVKDKGEVLSLDTKDYYIVAGYGKEIGLWDIRTMKQIGKASYAHSESVNCVKFIETFLISGSEDNILNIFDLNNTGEPGTEVKNYLKKDSVYLTLNLGQSIESVSELDTGYLSVISTVNTFHVISTTGIEKFVFDAKNEQLEVDYILDSYYNPISHMVTLFCGNYHGGISLFNCNLSNNPVSIEVDTKYKCMEEQTFNSVVKIREDAFITATDKGKLLVLKKVQNN